MRLDQAKRNEKLCRKLYNEGEFYDWVLTTAFYSSMHYVYHKLFPMNVNGCSYATFSDYYHKEIYIPSRARGVAKKSQHSVTKELVDENFNSICAYYRQLFDLCHSARYNSYKVSKKKANKALTFLDKIIEVCYDISVDESTKEVIKEARVS